MIDKFIDDKVEDLVNDHVCFLSLHRFQHLSSLTVYVSSTKISHGTQGSRRFSPYVSPAPQMSVPSSLDRHGSTKNTESDSFCF